MIYCFSFEISCFNAISPTIGQKKYIMIIYTSSNIRRNIVKKKIVIKMNIVQLT